MGVLQMSQKGLDRREFIQFAGAGVAFGGVASTGAVAGNVTPKPAPVCAAEDDRNRFTYFGPGKDVRSSYYKFQNTPVSKIDLGLTADQEAHAKELHKSLHIYDSIVEVGYYDGLLDDIERSGAASVCASYTIDAIPFDLVGGLDEDMRIRPEDWWARSTIESNLAFIEQMIAHEGDRVMICTRHADLMKAKQTGKIGLMLDCQNTQYIRNDLKQLDHFYNLGLRRQQLSYNFQMQTATGCMEPRDGGVTKWGARVIGKLNDLNMLVDTAHCSSRTLLDAIDISEKPISCSHAGMRAIAPNNPRTHTDEGLKKLADSGGVYGVVGVPGTLVPGSDKASVADYVNAIDRAVNLMGIDHVGFALDQPKAPSSAEWFTAPDWPPEAVAAVSVTAWPWPDLFLGLENQSGYINMTRGLVAKGYSDDDIRKVMGGNDMRLVKEVIG
jgi:microsomal dipeptidase-like Zn-dependent dipeptidase